MKAGINLAALLLLAAACGTALPADQPSLSVTVIGRQNDARAIAVREAVRYWNQQLQSIGVRERLGPVRFIDGVLPEARLDELRHTSRRDGPPAMPDEWAHLRGDVIVALSEGEYPSFTLRMSSGAELITIRRGDIPPLSEPNVARNVIAHEIGHALGLRHNGDPATLMCGRPAPCRPDVFAGGSGIFPLDASEQAELRRRFGDDATGTR